MTVAQRARQASSRFDKQFGKLRASVSQVFMVNNRARGARGLPKMRCKQLRARLLALEPKLRPRNGSSAR
jgi:hypothetical protein